jgi:cobalamin biosynthesis protein CobD/CbiB
MAFLSLLLALAVEQWRPLVDRRFVFAPMSGYAGFLERNFDAGEAQQGTIAWFLAVVPVVAAAWAIYAALGAANPLLALAFNVVVLYFTMGFRQHSHYFTDIHKALKDGDLDAARRLLAHWRGHPCDTLNASEVARLTIEGALTVSHRHVFGPIFWFVLLPGPSGAILYRFALFLNHRWGGLGRVGASGPLFDLAEGAAATTDLAGPETRAAVAGRDEAGEPTGRFGEFARIAFRAIDWLPARFTAAGFAIVGDFEDAAYCWRTQAARWPDAILGVVLAAGAGALGVRLGMPIPRGTTLEDRPELGLGEEADTPFLDSTVGLVWRALVLWLVLRLLLSVARAFG